MPVKDVVAGNWSTWVRGSDGYLRSDDPYGTYGSATPALPTLITTTYSLPGGNTWTATNTGSNSAAGTGTGNRTDCGLQYALDNCAGGDIVVITKGSTYTGPFTITNKSGSSFVYVVSSGDPGIGGTGLPAAGTRVVAADVTSMAIVEATNAGGAALVTVNGSHHFRFVGINFKNHLAENVGSIVNLGNGDTSSATLPDNIFFDRCYFLASTSTTHSGRRGMYFNGKNLAVFDSRFEGFFDDGFDSQAILTIYGDGPFKIVNNYLEGASENVMFGGGDPLISNNTPSNIEIRHNYFEKRAAWIGAGHSVKNHLELKNAKRVLVEGNTFVRCWADAQNGTSIVLNVSNQDGTAPWSETSDITIRLNKISAVGGGIAINGRSITVGYTTQITNRVLIENNVITVADPSTGADNRMFAVSNGPQYVTIRHNTTFQTAGPELYLFGNGSLLGNFLVFRDNITSWGDYGIFNDVSESGTTALNRYNSANYTVSFNAYIGGSSSGMPSGNFYPANTGAVGFTNYAGGDYSLTVGSAYHNAASDGTDVGANIAAVNAATA